MIVDPVIIVRHRLHSSIGHTFQVGSTIEDEMLTKCTTLFDLRGSFPTRVVNSHVHHQEKFTCCNNLDSLAAKSDWLQLCLPLLPGLVMPKYANAKAEMVAAGVIPIDKLVDVRGPIEVVAARVGRKQLESVYGFKLPKPQPHEDPSTPPAASHCLR